MKRSSRKSGWFFGKGVFRFDALLLFQGAFTFSFGRPKEKGNKKKKRRLPFGDGSEAVPGGNAGTRFAQTACVSSRRSPLLRFFAPKLRPEPSSCVGTHGPCVLKPTTYTLAFNLPHTWGQGIHAWTEGVIVGEKEDARAVRPYTKQHRSSLITGLTTQMHFTP